MNKEKVLEELKKLEIDYELVEHGAVYTIDEMENLDTSIFKNAQICKNLFLRDAKGKRHFLVIVCADKTVDLKELPNKIGSTRLSFASAERLQKYLDVEHGYVSPLSVINDKNGAVEVVIDNDLKNEELLAVHPNDNTCSVLIKYEDMMKYIKEFEEEILYVNI